MTNSMEPNLNQYYGITDDDMHLEGITESSKDYDTLLKHHETLIQDLLNEKKKWQLIEYRYKYLEDNFTSFLKSQEELKQIKDKLKESTITIEQFDKYCQTLDSFVSLQKSNSVIDYCTNMSIDEELLIIEKNSLQSINSKIQSLKDKIKKRPSSASLQKLEDINIKSIQYKLESEIRELNRKLQSNEDLKDISHGVIYKFASTNDPATM
ncbi:unnamed protein product [Diamesa serratosioi]